MTQLTTELTDEFWSQHTAGEEHLAGSMREFMAKKVAQGAGQAAVASEQADPKESLSTSVEAA